MAKYSSLTWKQLATIGTRCKNSHVKVTSIRYDDIELSKILESVKNPEQEVPWISYSQSLNPDQRLESLLKDKSIKRIIVPNPMPPQLELLILRCNEGRAEQLECIFEPHHRRLSSKGQRLKQIDKISNNDNIIAITTGDFYKMVRDINLSEVNSQDTVALAPEIFFNHVLLERVNFAAICLRLGIYYTLGATQTRDVAELNLSAVTVPHQKQTKQFNLACTLPRYVIECALQEYNSDKPLRFVGPSGAGKDSVIESYYKRTFEQKEFKFFRYNACQGEGFEAMMDELKQIVSESIMSSNKSRKEDVGSYDIVVVSEANLLEAKQYQDLIELFKILSSKDRHRLILTENDGSMTGRRSTSRFIRENTHEIQVPGFDTQDLLQLAKSFLLDALAKEHDDRLTKVQGKVIEIIVAYHNSINSLIHPRSKCATSRQLKFAMQAYANQPELNPEANACQLSEQSKATRKQALFFAGMRLDKLLEKIKQEDELVELIIVAEHMAPDQRSAYNLLLDMDASELRSKYNIHEIIVSYGSVPLELIGADVLNRLQPSDGSFKALVGEKGSDEFVSKARELISSTYIQLDLLSADQRNKLANIFRHAPENPEKFRDPACVKKERAIQFHLAGFNVVFDNDLKTGRGQCIIHNRNIRLSSSSDINLVMRQVNIAKKIQEIYLKFINPNICCPAIHFDDSMTYDRSTRQLHLNCNCLYYRYKSRFVQLIFESILCEVLENVEGNLENYAIIGLAQIIRRACVIAIKDKFKIGAYLSRTISEAKIFPQVAHYWCESIHGCMENLYDRAKSTAYYSMTAALCLDVKSASEVCGLDGINSALVKSNMHPELQALGDGEFTAAIDPKDLLECNKCDTCFGFYFLPGDNSVEIPIGVGVIPPQGTRLVNHQGKSYLYLPKDYPAGIHIIRAWGDDQVQYGCDGTHRNYRDALYCLGVSDFRSQAAVTASSTHVHRQYSPCIEGARQNPDKIHLRRAIDDIQATGHFDKEIPVCKVDGRRRHNCQLQLNPFTQDKAVFLPFIYPACVSIQVNNRSIDPKKCLSVNDKGQVLYYAKRQDAAEPEIDTTNTVLDMCFVDAPDLYKHDDPEGMKTYYTNSKPWLQCKEHLSKCVKQCEKPALEPVEDHFTDDYKVLFQSLSAYEKSSQGPEALRELLDKLKDFLAGFKSEEDCRTNLADEDQKWMYYFKNRAGHCQHQTLISHGIFRFLNIPARVIDSSHHRWLEYWSAGNNRWEKFDTGNYHYSDKLDLNALLVRLDQRKAITRCELNNTTNSAKVLVEKLGHILAWRYDNCTANPDKFKINELLIYPAIFQSVLPSLIVSSNVGVILQELENYNMEELHENLKCYPSINSVESAQVLLKCSMDQRVLAFSSGNEVQNWITLLCKKIQLSTLLQACVAIKFEQDKFEYYVHIYLYLLSQSPGTATKFKNYLMDKHVFFNKKDQDKMPSIYFNPYNEIPDDKFRDLDKYLDFTLSPGIITKTMGGGFEYACCHDEFRVAIIYDSKIPKNTFIAVLHRLKYLLDKKLSRSTSCKTSSLDIYTLEGVYNVSLGNINRIYPEFKHKFIKHTESKSLVDFLGAKSQFPIILEADKLKGYEYPAFKSKLEMGNTEGSCLPSFEEVKGLVNPIIKTQHLFRSYSASRFAGSKEITDKRQEKYCEKAIEGMFILDMKCPTGFEKKYSITFQNILRNYLRHDKDGGDKLLWYKYVAHYGKAKKILHACYKSKCQAFISTIKPHGLNDLVAAELLAWIKKECARIKITATPESYAQSLFNTKVSCNRAGYFFERETGRGRWMRLRNQMKLSEDQINMLKQSQNADDLLFELIMLDADNLLFELIMLDGQKPVSNTQASCD